MQAYDFRISINREILIVHILESLNNTFMVPNNLHSQTSV